MISRPAFYSTRQQNSVGIPARYASNSRRDSLLKSFLISVYDRSKCISMLDARRAEIHEYDIGGRAIKLERFVGGGYFVLVVTAQLVFVRYSNVVSNVCPSRCTE